MPTRTLYQTPRERVVAGFGAAAIVTLLGIGLLSGLHVDTRTIGQQALALIDIAPPKPPPPIKKPVEPPRPSKAKKAPSPPNLRNHATPIVAPPPVIHIPVPPPVIAAPKPGTGTAANNGASNRSGPGQGAGGEGNGLGGGGDGDGDFTPPRQTRGNLKFSDMPADLRASRFKGTVGVRFYVNTDGRVSGCVAEHSSGSAELDAITCQLIEQRFRYTPSRDPDGRPVRSIMVENHSWSVDRDDDNWHDGRDDGDDDR